MCHLPVRCCTDPSGAAYSNVQVFISNKEPGVGSRAYIPTCLPVARDEDGGSLLLLVRLKTYVTGLRCNIDAILMITIFCTMVLSTDPRNGIDTHEFCLLIKAGRYTILRIKLFWCYAKVSKALTNLMAHFTFLAFKFLTMWLFYVDVILASCKLEISQTMPSWGKLSTLHFSYLS
jgi:hypothetical protein